MSDLDPLIGLLEGLTRLARVQLDLSHITVALQRAAAAQQKRVDSLLESSLPKMVASAERGVLAMLAVQDTLESGIVALLDQQALIADNVLEDGLRDIERPLRVMPYIDRNLSHLVYTADDILQLLRRLMDRMASFQAAMVARLCAIERVLDNVLGVLWVLVDAIFWATTTLFVPIALGFARLSAELTAILNQMRVWGLEGIFRMLEFLSQLTGLPILDILSLFVTKLFEGVVAQIQKMADSIIEAIKGVAEQIKALAEAQKECCEGKEDDDDDDKDDPWWKKILKDWDKIIDDPWGYLVDWVKDWLWSWFEDGIWGLVTNIASLFLPPFLRAPFKWLMGLLGDFFPQLKEWLASAFWSVLGWVWDGISTLGSWVWDGLSAVGGWIWDGLSAAGQWIWDGITGLGEAIWDGLGSIASGIWDWVSGTAEWMWDGITGLFGYGDEEDPTPVEPTPTTDPTTPKDPTRTLDPKKYDVDYLKDVQGTLDRMYSVPQRLGSPTQTTSQENQFHTNINLNMPQGTTQEQTEFMRREAAGIFHKEWEAQMRKMDLYQNDKLTPGIDPNRRQG